MAKYRTRTADTHKAGPKKTRNKFVPQKRKRLDAGVSIAAGTGSMAFPTDTMGVTRELRTVLLSLATKVHGDAKKLKLIKDTIEIGVAHIEERFTERKEADHAGYRTRTAETHAEVEAEEIEDEDEDDGQLSFDFSPYDFTAMLEHFKADEAVEVEDSNPVEYRLYKGKQVKARGTIEDLEARMGGE